MVETRSSGGALVTQDEPRRAVSAAAPNATGNAARRSQAVQRSRGPSAAARVVAIIFLLDGL
jgi:hypothetical protein